MGNRFTPKTEGLLIASGWFPGRKVEWQAKAEMRLPTVSIFAAANAILEEFAGLEIAGTSQLCFVARYGQPIEDDLAKIHSITGLTMYPVGDTNDGGDTQVLVDTNGRIYWLFESIEFIGDNIDMALEFLISRPPWSPLPPAPLDMPVAEWKIRNG